jgi:hypothetical protein
MLIRLNTRGAKECDIKAELMSTLSRLGKQFKIDVKAIDPSPGVLQA